jgi:hypothetical protein
MLFEALRQEINGDSTLRTLHDEVATGNQSDKWKLMDSLIVVDGHQLTGPTMKG